ncbi:MAG: beta-lactamase family protein [Clostridia bacterium]|nr:beta-lactamase family protein [Clostridia bacterium]
MRNLSERERLILERKARAFIKTIPPIGELGAGSLNEKGTLQVQKCFESILRAHRAVGASMILVFPDGSEKIFCYGKARRKPEIAVDPLTCFRVASVTKLISTFGIMSLVESDELNLDEDVSKLLGFSFRNPLFPDRPVTLRMLLTHTAGIKNADLQIPGKTSLEERFTDPEIWLESAPGERFLYTNLGAGLSGAIAERASGLSFENMMQERIFRPLGICAGYGAANIPVDRMIADGYSVRGLLPPCLRYDAEQQRRQHINERPGETYVTTVGRLITDAHGLGTLARLLASKTDTGVLTKGSLDEMRKVQDDIGGIRKAGRGLNVAFLKGVIPEMNLIGHQGVAYGMCSELFVDSASGACIGIMTNGVQLNRMALQPVGEELLLLGMHAIQRVL